MTSANQQQTASKTIIEPGANDREIVFSRVLDAPRDLVFKAWTDPQHLAEWWGPSGWTLPICEVDFRPGGAWLYCMRGPDGEESWGKAVYREIVEPERIVYTDHFADAQGNPVEGMPSMEITVEFIDQGGATKLVSRTLFATPAEREAVLAMGAVEGMSQSADRLDAYLEKIQGR